MEYRIVNTCDEELYQFYLRQKKYFSLFSEDITYEYIQQDMLGPKGFDEKNHFHYKIYDQNQMVAYIDYCLGYRYSMVHDESYIWIGLFLVDEKFWRQHYGEKIITKFCHHYQNYQAIQLACLLQNRQGQQFWEAMGFHRIDCSYSGHEEVIVFEKCLTKEKL